MVLVCFDLDGAVASLLRGKTSFAEADAACKPNLIKNAVFGGVLFTGLNFFFFAFMSSAFPSFLTSWNMSTLSGIVVLGIPVETVMFGFTFGMAWSGVYLHVKRYTLLSNLKPVEPDHVAQV